MTDLGLVVYDVFAGNARNKPNLDYCNPVFLKMYILLTEICTDIWAMSG